MSDGVADIPGRKRAMRLAALAGADELAGLVGPPPEDATILRAPEIGLALVRGRIGGDGRAFNMGEATVTRAAVRLSTGEIGYGHVLGRKPEIARLAAFIDALRQRPEHRARIDAGLAAVEARFAAADECARRRAAATRVDFFTLARGE